MKFLTAKAQMTLGLICLQISVLCGAMLFGFVPEQKSAVMQGRADLCEAVAIVSSQAISEGRFEELGALLNQMMLRNDDLLSAAVRTDDDRLLAELGDHEAHWERSGTRSTENQVLVPIHAATTDGSAGGPGRWGAVELRFRPFSEEGLTAFVRHPWVQMTVIVSFVTGLFYYFYLKKMLQHLDPSRAVPQRVRDALDSLAEGLLVLDRDENIVLANHAFAEWVDMPPDRLTGLNASSFDWVTHATDRKLTGFPWTDALQNESAQAGIMIGLDRPGQATQDLIANASPVLGHDGSFGGVLVSFDDVTQLEEIRRELKVARDQAESAQHQAEEANKAKSDFLARMSHEIRTPMNAILGYTEVLRTGDDEDVADRHRHLDTIHASGEHLLALINDILDLSKIESGQMDLDMQTHSLRDLVSQVVSVMNVKAQEKQIGLHLEAEQLMPETIRTDAVRFRQAVFNLVGNAVKFTEQGCVRIVLSLTADQKLKVDVVDTGVGIAADAVDKVFEQFTQADASVSTKFGGTGLGLSISRQLARMMGGDIKVSSKLGTGSTFSLIIDPGSLDGIPRIDPTTEAPAAARQNAADALRLPDCRILIVDDEKANRGLAGIHIKRAGGRSDEAADGREAVNKAMAEDFDVILMDFNMPVMGGLDATRELRRLGNDVPVIALTANVLEDDRQSAFDAGCNGFLTKPIRMADLVNGIRELLPNELFDHDAQPSAEPAATQPAEPPQPAVQNSTADPTAANNDGATKVEQSLPQTSSVKHPSIITSQTTATDSDAAQLAAAELNLTETADTRMPNSHPENIAASQVPTHEEVASEIDQPAAAPPEAPEDLLQQSVPANSATDTGSVTVPSSPAADVDELLRSIEATLQKAQQTELPQEDQTEPERASNRAPAVPAAEAVASEPCEATTTQPPAAESTQKAGADIADPIESLLPIDDPEFFEIVADFPVRLNQQVDDMRTAFAAHDLQQLKELAHWLKGTGETLGFPAFTAPARSLEEAAGDSQMEAVAERLHEIESLAARVVVRPPENVSL